MSKNSSPISLIDKKFNEVSKFYDLDNLSDSKKTSSIYTHMLDTLKPVNKKISRPTPRKMPEIKKFMAELSHLVSKKNKLGFTKNTISDAKQEEIQQSIDALLEKNKVLIETIYENIKEKNIHVLHNISDVVQSNECTQLSGVYLLSHFLNKANVTNLIGTALIDDHKLKEVNVVLDADSGAFFLYDLYSDLKSKKPGLKSTLQQFLTNNGEKVDFVKFDKLDSQNLDVGTKEKTDIETLETLSDDEFSNIIQNLAGFKQTESEKEMQA